MKGAIERVLAILEERGVEYLVVGGVAVVLHGHLRTTADLDLLLRLTSENTALAIKSLTRLGFEPREGTHLRTEPKAWIEARGLRVFSLVDPGNPTFAVDLFGSRPEDFDAISARACRVDLDHTPTTVVGLADLVSMKVAAGRPKDLDDVLHLEALRELDGKVQPA